MVGDVERDEGVEFLHRAFLSFQREIELAKQLVDVVLHQVEQQLLLGADMIVQRSHLDSDLGREVAQAHRLVAMFEDEAQPGLPDRFQRLRAV